MLCTLHLFGLPCIQLYSLKNRTIPRAAKIEENGLGPLVFRDHARPVTAYADLDFDECVKSSRTLMLKPGTQPRNKNDNKGVGWSGDDSSAVATTTTVGEDGRPTYGRRRRPGHDDGGARQALARPPRENK